MKVNNMAILGVIKRDNCSAHGKLKYGDTLFGA